MLGNNIFCTRKPKSMQSLYHKLKRSVGKVSTFAYCTMLVSKELSATECVVFKHEVLPYISMFRFMQQIFKGALPWVGHSAHGNIW